MFQRILKLRSPSKAEQEIDSVLNSARQIVGVAQDATCPIPGLVVAVTTLSSLIEILVHTKGNLQIRNDLADNIKTLATDMENTITTVTSASTGFEAPENSGFTSPELEERVNALKQKLDELVAQASKVNELQQKKFTSNKASVDGLLTSLQQGVHDVDTEFFGTGENSIEKLFKKVIDQVIEKGLSFLPHVDARHTSPFGPRNGVFEGTRAAILDDVLAWTRGPDSTGYDPILYLLSGSAGTGKTTIAFEVANRLSESNALGASFFFVRNVDRLDSVRHVIPTLAYQLARAYPEICPHIMAAAVPYRHIGMNERTRFEIETLLINPLKNVTPSLQRLTIILDGVDDCKQSTRDDMMQVIYLLMRRLPELPFQLRVLFSTRPELRVQDAIDAYDFRNKPKPFMVKEIVREGTTGDIRSFFRERLMALSCHEEIFKAHPNVVDDLTARAGGLFIYATTMMKFLEQDSSRAVETLNEMLT